MRGRYLATDFRSSAWLPLYEVQRRAWDVTPAFNKIGQAQDVGQHFQHLQGGDVHFYQTDPEVFSVEAFEGWNLNQADFQDQPIIDLDFEPEALEYENYWSDY